MDYTKIAFSERWLDLQDLDGEIWKDISGYEGLYQISNYGRVKSLSRLIHFYSYSKMIETKIMHLNITGKNGKTYLAVHLNKNGKREIFKVHKLVALHFLSNDGLPCINHKNEDKFDNMVENLEWCTYSYNNTYNKLKERQHQNKLNPIGISYPVLQYDKDGQFIAEYPSMSEASRQTGVSLSIIRSFCERNRNRKCFKRTKDGFKWFVKEGTKHRNNRKNMLDVYL